MFLWEMTLGLSETFSSETEIDTRKIMLSIILAEHQAKSEKKDHYLQSLLALIGHKSFISDANFAANKNILLRNF